jgi:hypothetical protein
MEVREMERAKERERKREAGAALLVSMLLLAMMAMIGLASFDTVMRDSQVAGFQSRSRVALYAAEAGLATALALIRQDTQGLADGGTAALEDWNPTFPTELAPQVLGSSAHPPSFYANPDATKPIRYMGAGDPCWSGEPEGLMSQESGAIQWRDALWDVRVVGDTNDGTKLPLQGTATNCHPYDG